MSETFALHWFRRDLRVEGNEALAAAAREHGGRVLGLLCFDADAEARPDFSIDRAAFHLATARALRDELRAAGGDLLVLDEAAPTAFERLLARGVRPVAVSFGRDYGRAARAEEEDVTATLARRGVAAAPARDHLLVEPHELRKPAAGPDEPSYYQVYTPFARRWFELLATPLVKARLPARPARPKLAATWARRAPGVVDALDRLADELARRARVPLPAAGRRAALARLRAFAPRLEAYAEDRDRPAIEGTSRLSIDLRQGALTTADVVTTLGLSGAPLRGVSGRATFLRELAWREFAFHVLAHRPDVAERAFQPRFRALAWENREDWFEAWKAGRTGYALVDAGMRQLAETGFMHNRLRMIVASFLTKDLLVDWRWGERHFMRHLLDGDLAPNNLGWQWAASTGCDAQPYFRVFNPTAQARKFDPTGAYVRAWLREPPRAPIVEHGVQRARALALYGRASTLSS
jgi:deoxyribodipyrimidine photo-lyase